MSDERAAKREYQREYRARGGGKSAPADRANARATAAAAKLLRESCPELWRELLTEARESLGLPVATGPGGNFTIPQEHGTTTGHRQHLYRGEDPCDACKAAMTRSRKRRE
jgi:hypothetical protein